MIVYKIRLLRILFFLILVLGCQNQGKRNDFNKNIENEKKSSFFCSNFSCLEKNKNSVGTIEGIFRKYTPNKIGKGANHMYWDWELLLTDSLSVPIINIDTTTNISIYENKKVSIYGNLFHGIIIGNSSTIEEERQSATGYRIDAILINIKK